MVGLTVAVINIDEIIALIRNAKDPNEAREGLMSKPWPAKDVAPLIELIDDPEHAVDDRGNYTMSEAQARAILEMRLHRLTGLEREKIDSESKLREFFSLHQVRAERRGQMPYEFVCGDMPL